MTGIDSENVEVLRNHLRTLRERRQRRKASSRRRSRQRLTSGDRAAILAKTDGRCHVCGGAIGEVWQADHVLAHSGGGSGARENCLAAHQLCNNYRWDYLSEEFQIIMKLGVWARTQVEKGTVVGRQIAAQFLAHDARRLSRRGGRA